MKYRIGLGICIASVAAVAQSPSPVPNPTVIGPIPAAVPAGDPSHDYTFLSTTADLGRYGYVEEEYFFEGTANRYNTPALATGSVKDSGHPYRTRMVVRRPISARNFNGTVLMEWQNVSSGMDMDLLWLIPWTHDHLMRSGYAWVGVSAQQAGIFAVRTGLKAWSSSRYGTLDVTEGGSVMDDALAYDIFAQAAQSVRRPTGVDPMGGLRAERVFAEGVSLAANRLGIYYNSVHPLAGMFDGFVLVGGGGQLRTDLDVKAFKVYTETEVRSQAAKMRQPDSDHLRSWEVAGASHYPFEVSEAITPLRIRDGVVLAGYTCDRPPLSRIPYTVVINAVLDHLFRWVQQNVPPPSAPRIEVVTLGPPAVIARDSFGNGLGGIRLSQHDVPTATNTGENSGPGFCSVFGSYQLFDEATLRALYRDHGAYVSQVSQAAIGNWKDGYVVLEDAIAALSAAVSSGIGQQ